MPDLAALGVSLGHRKKLLRAIAALGEPGRRPPHRLPPPPRTIALAERRHLTVMFCDLVGSTEFSTRLDPEDLRDVMQRFQECCVEVIGRYGGHIGNYIGDGILAISAIPAPMRMTPSGRCAPGSAWSRRSPRSTTERAAIRRRAGDPDRHQYRSGGGWRHRHRREPATRWRWSARRRTSPPVCRSWRSRATWWSARAPTG